MEPNYQKAKEVAEEVLELYEMREPIINVFEIAEQEGIDVRFIEMPVGKEDIAGFLTTDEKIIYVNSEQPINRQVFTVAHELGHHFLKHDADHRNVLYRHPQINGDNWQEKEANCFAGNLLVPDQMLKYEMKKYRMKKDSVSPELLAVLFGVSKDVIRHRLKHS